MLPETKKRIALISLILLTSFLWGCIPGGREFYFKKTGLYQNNAGIFTIVKGYNGKMYGDCGNKIVELNSKFVPVKTIWHINDTGYSSGNYSDTFPVISGGHFLFKIINIEDHNPILLEIDLNNGVKKTFPLAEKNYFWFSGIRYENGLEQSPLIFKDGLLFINFTTGIIVFDPSTDFFRTIYLGEDTSIIDMSVSYIPSFKEKIRSTFEYETQSPNIYVIDAFQFFKMNQIPYSDPYICEIKIAYNRKLLKYGLKPHIDILSIDRFHIPVNFNIAALLYVTKTDMYGFPETITLCGMPYYNSLAYYNSVLQTNIYMGQVFLRKEETAKKLSSVEYVISSKSLPLHFIYNSNYKLLCISNKNYNCVNCQSDLGQFLYKPLMLKGVFIRFHREICKDGNGIKNSSSVFAEFIPINKRSRAYSEELLCCNDKILSICNIDKSELLVISSSHIYKFEIITENNHN